MVRRALLALVTALIVARPFVLGEDPGFLSPLTSASGLLLSLLWFLAAAGWAAWRAWSKQGTSLSSLVLAGLGAAVVLVFLSTARAHYKHPAVLISCEWLLLLLAFVVVRQLAQSAAENRALLAALLATSVSLSAYAVYQYKVEMPADRSELTDEELQAQLSKLNIHIPAHDPQLHIWRDRLQENNVFGTFAHPNSFAGYLALLLPPLAGWSLAGRRLTQRRWLFFAVVTCTLLTTLALWWTHSRGAILAIMLVGLVAAAVRWRDRWWKYKVWTISGLGAIAATAFLVSRLAVVAEGLARAQRSFGLRADYWSATWAMIRDHLWLGVGPGNFGRLYPRYMLASAFERIQDPHNFLLETWATSGIFALLALLTALGGYFVLAVRGPWASASSQDPDAPDSGLRWEFYAGGMLGLILGFALRTIDLPGDEMLGEGMLSAGRSLIWFAVFALLMALPWAAMPRALACTAGVAALLLNLCVSGGISSPSVAGPLWILAALALNSARETRSEPSLLPSRFALASGHWLGWVLPLPIVCAAALMYHLVVFTPVAGCAAYLAEARSHYGQGEAPGWENDVEKRLVAQLSPDAAPQQRAEAIYAANEYLKRFILKPLEAASRADPNDSTPLIELTHWYTIQANLVRDAPEIVQKAIRACARRAQSLDPDNRQVYVAEYELHLVLAKRSKDHAAEHYGGAAQALKRAVDCDPTDAPLRYLLAEVSFLAGDRVQGRAQAEIADRLDRLATRPERQLTPQHREQIKRWTGERGALAP